ncbi:MAG: prepilin-type N-terminal cleavage/methylation domain-containing protein [Patescibacteria group bacterium]
MSSVNYHKSLKRGFTLVEILVSLALVSIIVVLSIPVFQSFQNRNDLDIASTTITQSWRRAQLLSQAVSGDSTWGVKIQPGNIVLFKGTSYITRDTNYDEKFILPATIQAVSPDGATEIVFTKFDGLPQSSGSVVLSNTGNNFIRNIGINAKGTVTY